VVLGPHAALRGFRALAGDRGRAVQRGCPAPCLRRSRDHSRDSDPAVGVAVRGQRRAVAADICPRQRIAQQHPGQPPHHSLAGGLVREWMGDPVHYAGPRLGRAAADRADPGSRVTEHSRRGVQRIGRGRCDAGQAVPAYHSAAASAGACGGGDHRADPGDHDLRRDLRAQRHRAEYGVGTDSGVQHRVRRRRLCPRHGARVHRRRSDWSLRTHLAADHAEDEHGMKASLPARTLRVLAIVAIVVWSLRPVAVGLLTSLSTQNDVETVPARWIPHEFSTSAYKALITGTNTNTGNTAADASAFGASLLSSIEVTIEATVATLIVSVLAGYGFSRLQFRGSKVLLWAVLA